VSHLQTVLCESERMLNGFERSGGQAGHRIAYRSEYLSFSIAEKRAAFSFLRFFALGFSKRRCRRTCNRVCSRSSFFLSRRRAFSTGSPFLSLISVIGCLDCA